MPASRPVFRYLEKPFACITLSLAAVTLIWKAFGLHWLPTLGAATHAIFEVKQNGDLAQYPRRPEDEAFWNIVYLLMYGLLGTTAQYGGLIISSRHDVVRKNSGTQTTDASKKLARWAQLYAIFHTIIGYHHICWALNYRRYGKLEMWRYDFPFIHALTALTAFGLICHALQILRGVTGKSKIHWNDIGSRKTIMDACTITTFTSFFVFLLYNAANIQTTFEMERFWWAITMYPVVAVLGLGTWLL